ncbi:MAG: hypothetical protein GY940_26580 [bacterium]|nr:hypothetical protein [bacterium]
MEKKLSGGDETKGLGVWIIVDTSASMSTMQQGETRMAAALREVDQALSNAQKAGQNKDLCFRLSALDLEKRDLLLKGDALAVEQAVSNLEPRPLGTDLGILRRLIRSLNDQAQVPVQAGDKCQISHLVIITDHPAPDWLSGSDDIQVVWRDIGLKVDNLGLTHIRAVRDPLTGFVSEVRVGVTLYGTVPPNTRFTVIAPDGSKIKDEPLLFPPNRLWQGSFPGGQAGQYRLSLSSGGAYTFDDSAVIEIGKGQEVRVDWKLRDRRLLRQMGWVQDSVKPQLRVTNQTAGPMDIPTLIVGPGYGKLRNTPAEIRDFMEASPLLADVNLDAVETLGLRDIQLPRGFQPVLRGMNGSAWLAQADEPVRAMVPGLPTGGEDVTGRFSATVFFNALRWLLKKRELPPLYDLTAPHALQPGVNRLVLHKDEGNTQRVTQSSGKLENLKPVVGKGKTKPVWPVLLMIAVILFLIERTLAVLK